MGQMVRKNYPELGEVKAPYVHSVKHGNTLYISGLTAFGTCAQQAGIGTGGGGFYADTNRCPRRRHRFFLSYQSHDLYHFF